MSATDLPVPEGMVARFEHHRRVLLVAEAHPPAETGPILMYSEPLWMRSWEWHKCRKDGYGVYVLPEGGATTCRLYKRSTIEGEPDELVSFGEVRCSNSDHYVKATGRIKAFGAAVQAFRRSTPSELKLNQ